MKVTKAHTIYQFTQSHCLAKCIEYNADQRAKIETKFEKLTLQIKE